MGIEQIGRESFKIEVSEPNIKQIVALVLDRFQEYYKALEEEAPDLPPEQLVEKTIALVRHDYPHITRTAKDLCNRAMNYRPALKSRKDFVGRVLFHQMEMTFPNHPEELTHFKVHFLRASLSLVKEIIGDQRYEFFNKALKNTIESNCVVRDLDKALVNWDTFHDRQTAAVVLRQTKVITDWVKNTPNGHKRFITRMNELIQEYEADAPPFTEKHLGMIMRSWGTVNDSSRDIFPEGR